MVDLKDWCEYVRTHPAKFRFDGLHGRGRSSKSDFFQTVGEAAVADERFMDQYMADEYESHAKAFDEAVEAKEDRGEYLSQFCEFAEHRTSHAKWTLFGLPVQANWISAPIDRIMEVVDKLGDDLKDQYIWDWVIGDDRQPYWDMIQEPHNQAYLLEEHPPVAIWCNAGGHEIKLEDVFFQCPSCGEPQTEQDLKDMYGTHNGYPHFYCGGCGSEMSVGRKEHILDFFLALEVTPYPYNAEKRPHWQGLMAARKAWGHNKLELKVGEQVHLKKCQELQRETGPGTWLYWSEEPGELVTVTHTGDTEISYVLPDGSGFGGISYDKLYGRPTE